MANENLVTLAEVKGSLKFDMEDSSDDPRLDLLIGAASVSILRFLKSDGDEFRDSDGNIEPGNVDDDIKEATIMLVGIMDRSPDINKSGVFDKGWLPAPIESILHSRREPTVA